LQEKIKTHILWVSRLIRSVCKSQPFFKGAFDMQISKVLNFKLDGMNVSAWIDGDVDGEPSVSLTIKLPEVFAEALALFTKPKA